ncbi:MAG: DUF3786 domain-containing protein [Candidatus Promineifilaceae bacterium]
MNEKWELPAAGPSQLAQRVEDMKARLGSLNPELLADRIGAVYAPVEEGAGIFTLVYWGREVTLSYPEFVCIDAESGRELGLIDQAMLAYYLVTTDGTPLAGQWIAFSQLPDGTFYTQAFQGYTGGELAKAFGDEVDRFAQLGTAVAGNIPSTDDAPGDKALAFQVLPNVRLLASCWLGDEDFPTSYRILFDAAAGRHLTTDAYAIMGSMLTKKIIKGSESRERGPGMSSPHSDRCAIGDQGPAPPAWSG